MKFEYGDIVTYDGSLANPFGASDDPDYVLGRLHGKFKTTSVAQSFGWVPNSSRSELYVFAPEPKVSLSFDVFNGEPDAGFDDMKLEWGNYPKEDWFLVAEGHLKHIISEEMMEDFGKRGYCKRCGSGGEWRRLALFCKYHGRIL